jgi:hypothetical protein
VAKAAGDTANVPAELNRATGQVQVNMRSLAQSERAMLNRLGIESFGDLPKVAPQLSDEQVQALKGEWSQHMPYDLVRQFPEDRMPKNPEDHLWEECR